MNRFLIISLASSIFIPLVISAQMVTDTAKKQVDCTVINRTLKLGSRDFNITKDVTLLQIYLSQAGYLVVEPSGYFGKVTQKAIQDFQLAQGFESTGAVGPLTRAKIKALSCTSDQPSSIATTTQIYVNALDTHPPSVPTKLASNNVTQAGFILSWTPSSDNSRVTSYTIFKDGIPLGETTATSFPVRGLSASSKNIYTVSASDIAQNTSNQSVGLIVTTSPHTMVMVPDKESPSTPTNLSSSDIIQNSFTLYWIASTDNVGVVGYQIFKDGTRIGTSVSNSYTVTNQLPNTSGVYTVSSYDLTGNISLPSLSLVVTIPENIPQGTINDIQSPSIPSSLSAGNITSSGFTLSWAPSFDNVAVTGYKIYKNGLLLGTTVTSSYTVIGLMKGVIDVFTVSAYDAFKNNSFQSAPLSHTTPY